MIGEAAVNTFAEGMDKDTSRSKLKNTRYTDAQNIRVLTEEGQSSGSIENEKGTKFLFSLPEVMPSYKVTPVKSGTITIQWSLDTVTVTPCGDTAEEIYDNLMANATISSAVTSGYFDIIQADEHVTVVGQKDLTIVFAGSSEYTVELLTTDSSNLTILGTATVGDYVIVFSTVTSPSASEYGDWIWKFEYDTLNEEISSDYLNGTELDPSTALVYANDLGFSLSYPVEGFGYYRDSDYIKVYFWDGLNNLRHINIADSDAASLNPEDLELVSSASLTKPILSSLQAGGTLQAGVIQYAYQLYNTGGTTTAYSPVSNQISLTASNENTEKSYDYKGSERGEDTGKSVTMQISDIDQSYDWIRIVSIHYGAEGESPTINIIKDIPFSGTSYTFTDNGYSTEGTLTLQQFRSIGGLVLSPKHVEVKDNIMFLSNTEEELFEVTDDEFDARAYRWNSGGTTIRYKDEDGDNYFAYNTSIDSTADVIQDRDIYDLGYKYQKTNVGVLGGEGANISYTFKLAQLKGDAQETHGSDRLLYTDQYDIDWTSIGLETENTSFGNYASPYNSSQAVGYMRDEIYRFGIVFYDKKGRQSYAKWIADIKMPAVYETNSVVTYNTDPTSTLSGVDEYTFDLSFTRNGSISNDTYFNVLYPEFTVTIPSALGNKISGYEIVRMSREERDKSIVSQGIVVPTVVNIFGGGVDIIPNFFLSTVAQYDSATTKERRTLNFISPEINFRNSLATQTGDQMKILGEYNTKTQDTYTDAGWNYNVIKIRGTTSDDGTLQDIDNGQITPYTVDVDNPPTYSIHPTSSYANLAGTAGTAGDILAGTRFTYYTEDSIDTSGYSSGSYLFANYMRDVIQYGGSSYTSRSNSEYISTGAFNSSSSSSVLPTFGGDIYVAFFDYMVTMHDNAGTADLTAAYFPVETTINLPLRLDNCYHRIIPNVTNFAVSTISETVEDGQFLWGDDYPENRTDLYLENSVYSKDNTSKVFLPKPLNYNRVVDNKYRTYYSLEKTTNDIEDRWLIFLEDNYKDVDPQYGEITNLDNLNDNLVFTQEKAVGLFGVNERALSSTEGTATTLVLGTGGVLDNFRYINNRTGTKNRTAVGNGGLYFYDELNRKIMVVGNSATAVSDIKGLSSYLKENVGNDVLDNDILGRSGVIPIFDFRNNRIYFTFLSSGTNFTVAYNELLQGFESFYNFTPSIYCSFLGRLFSVNDGGDFYIHNEGNYGNFYGSTTNSSISVVVNDKYDVNKMFNNMEFSLLVTDDGTPVDGVSISALTIDSEFNNNQVIPLTVGTNLKERLNTWRLKVPRDSGARYRGHYLDAKLTLSNSNNYRYVLNDLNTWYLRNIQ